MFSSDSSLCSSQVLRKSQALRRKVTEKRGEWGGEHRAEVVPEQADALENTWKAPRPSEALLQPPFFRPSGNQWPLWCVWSPVPGDLLSSAKGNDGDESAGVQAGHCQSRLLQNTGLWVHARPLRSKPRWALSVFPSLPTPGTHCPVGSIRPASEVPL